MKWSLRVVVVSATFLGLPTVAAAQTCNSCGGAGGAFAGRGSGCASGDPNCDRNGLKQYPKSELRYIKQFCGPHVSPASCFGYFRPQVTPWGVACPNYTGGPGPADPAFIHTLTPEYRFASQAATAPATAAPAATMPTPRPVANEPAPALPAPAPREAAPVPAPTPMPLSPQPSSPGIVPPVSVPEPVFLPPAVQTSPISVPRY